MITIACFPHCAHMITLLKSAKSWEPSEQRTIKDIIQKYLKFKPAFIVACESEDISLQLKLINDYREMLSVIKPSANIARGRLNHIVSSFMEEWPIFLCKAFFKKNPSKLSFVIGHLKNALIGYDINNNDKAVYKDLDFGIALYNKDNVLQALFYNEAKKYIEKTMEATVLNSYLHCKTLIPEPKLFLTVEQECSSNNTKTLLVNKHILVDVLRSSKDHNHYPYLLFNYTNLVNALYKEFKRILVEDEPKILQKGCSRTEQKMLVYVRNKFSFTTN